MQKFTKLLLLLAIEVAILVLFLAYSYTSKLIAAVVFPPAFAITLYFFIITLLDIKKESFNKMDLVFALLLAGVAIISSSAGFHLAANDISDEFIPDNSLTSSIDQIILNRLYFLDETFSHMLMIGGFAVILMTIILWWYLKRYKILSKQRELLTEGNILDFFLIVFVGALLGVFTALGFIEGQVIEYGVVLFTVLAILLLIKFRTAKPTPQGRSMVRFSFTFIAAYLATAVAHFIW